MIRFALVFLALSLAAGCGGSTPTDTENPTEAQEATSDDGATEGNDGEAAPVEAREPCAADDEMCLEERIGEERFGDLAIGLAMDDAIAAMGEPSAPMTEPQMMEATGTYYAELVWANGVMVALDATSDAGPFQVSGIGLSAGATLTTARGIGIGSTRAEVESAYADVIGRNDPLQITAGSPYFGVVFGLENDVVTSVFYGTLAE